MEAAIVNITLLNLHRLRQLLGVAGLAGLALAIAGLAIYMLAVLPAERQAQAKVEQLAHARMQPASAAVTAPVHMGDRDVLAQFYGQFPAMRNLPDMLQLLHALARKHEITLERGDFKFGKTEGDKLFRYQITLPVKCSYLNLRGFIDDAAHKLPTMGLSEISLKRESVGDGAVQAKLDFVMYLSDN